MLRNRQVVGLEPGAQRGFVDGWAGFVIAFGNFEGTFYRYAKRYEETQDWQPPPSKPIRC